MYIKQLLSDAGKLLLERDLILTVYACFWW